MRGVLLTLLALSLLPIVVFAAVAARLTFDDWRDKRDARRQAERGEPGPSPPKHDDEALRPRKRSLRLVEGGASGAPSKGEQPGKSA
jgi:hypothetical protein